MNAIVTNATDYDTDILEWSERQAAALRNLARARPDLSNELDWENIAEEIEGVGRSEFAAVLSYIRQILIHLIKAVSVPDAPSILHWRSEAGTFHRELLDRVTPSMLPRLDLSRVWPQALKQAELDLAVHGQPVLPGLPDLCPLSIQNIVDTDFDFIRAVEVIRSQIEDNRANS